MKNYFYWKMETGQLQKFFEQIWSQIWKTGKYELNRTYSYLEADVNIISDVCLDLSLIGKLMISGQLILLLLRNLRVLDLLSSMSLIPKRSSMWNGYIYH